MDDLFSGVEDADEARRDALRRKGWLVWPTDGPRWWKSPGGELLSEAEAFARLKEGRA
jgi:hypothetical protein